MSRWAWPPAAIALLCAFGCASGETGVASWYGPGFHGRPTASGEIFDQHAMSCAHRSAPFGSRLRVTDLSSGRSVVCRVNDRGPFTKGRVVDLSRAAAEQLGIIARGVAAVRVSTVN